MIDNQIAISSANDLYGAQGNPLNQTQLVKPKLKSGTNNQRNLSNNSMLEKADRLN